MDSGSIIIPHSLTETLILIEKIIPEIFGKIIKRESRQVVWEYEIGTHKITCKTSLSEIKGGTQISTTAESKTRKSSLVPVIQKFHNKISENSKKERYTPEVKPPKKEFYKYNKFSIYIAIAIIIVLGFFGYRSYNVIESEKKIYKASPAQHITYSEAPEITSTNQDKPVFKYKSSNNDLENATDIIRTTEEVTYHKFDFNSQEIELRARNKNGNWETFRYPFSEYERLENGIMEFKIKHPTCYQVWVSAAGNIGYELNNGQTLVFYDIKRQ